MIRVGRVVLPGTDRVLVTVDEVDSSAPGPVCCSVLSSQMEVGNPQKWELQPGETVEISDGLGRMILAGSSFLAFPFVLFVLGASFLFIGGLVGAVLGLACAVWFFKSQKLGQFPVVVGRRSPAPQDSYDDQ